MGKFKSKQIELRESTTPGLDGEKYSPAASEQQRCIPTQSQLRTLQNETCFNFTSRADFQDQTREPESKSRVEPFHQNQINQLMKLVHLASHPAAPGSIPDVAEINRRRWLEESGQRLENVDRTHQVLASGKLVLLKK